MVSSGAPSPPSGGPFAPSEIVREIGRRPNPVYAVRQTSAGAKPQLVIAERFEGGARAGSPAGEQLVREARRIATLASPNLARVREVVTRGDDLIVFTELIDGDKLEDLWQSRKLPLELALRVIVDVLAGVGAVHNLRDSKQQPMKLAHGELAPATIVLGLDGVARLLHSIARRAPSAAAEPASLGYLAPEVLAGEPFDARADVFGAGVLLWEALSGKRLVAEKDAADVARRIRSSAVPPASIPDKAAWAKGLVAVAAKALASSPDDRWPTASVLAAEIRKAAGLKLAPASASAAFARSAIGERVKARKESLEGSAPAASPKPAPVASPSEPPISVDFGDESEAATLPPPAPLPALKAETPSASVLVVPGIRADLAEVVELESSLLMPAPESVPPPAASSAASSAVGGFVLDPFTAAASLARAAPAFPQPSAPTPAIVGKPVVAVGNVTAERPEPPSVTGTPHFAATINLPPPAPLQGAHPGLLEETLATPSSEELRERGRRRRLKFVVLGSVAVLGATIFALAAVRVAGRDQDVPAATTRASVANAQAAATQPAPTTPPPLPVNAPPPAAPPTQVAVQAPPPAPAPSPAPAPTQPAPMAAAPAPRPTPTPTQSPAAATPPRVVPAAAPKPRPKPTFDPNSL